MEEVTLVLHFKKSIKKILSWFLVSFCFVLFNRVLLYNSSWSCIQYASMALKS